MTYVGGLRERLVHDSAEAYVRGGLGLLGWFNSGRHHQPINWLSHMVTNENEDIPFNTVAVSSTTVDSGDEVELGSNLTDSSTTFYVDVYAEDDALGRHLSGDIRDLLRGRFTTIGYTGPRLPVFDYTQVPYPVDPIFYCDIDNIVRDRATAFTQLWQRHWYVVRFTVIDTYADESYGGTP